MEPLEKQTYVADLIRELEGDALKFQIVGMAVKFSDRCELVYNHDPQKLTKLASLVKQDGTPIGVIGLAVEQDASIHAFVRPLTEFADDPAVKTYLNETVHQLALEMTEVASMLVTMGKETTGPTH
jgi:hypothetical protein